MSADKIPPAAPSKDTIYLEVDDEITTIIDKVENAKEKIVALVLPKRAAALQSIVNMRLLKRSAEDADKNVVLITADAALLPLAGAAGLHVAKNLASKPEVPAGPNIPKEPASIKAVAVAGVDEPEDEENLPSKIDYKKSIGDLAEAHDLDNPETIELGDEEAETAAAATEKPPKSSKSKAIKVPNFNKFRLWLALGAFGFIALIIFIVLAVSVLPKATIAIQTTSTPVNANLTIKTAGSVTSYKKDSGTIPGYSKTSDQTQSQQVTATGQQNNGSKATGTINLSEDPCSGPTTVPGGTGVSSSGLTFITSKSVTLNASGTDSKGFFICTGSVGVTAQAGGSKYNLASGSTFTVQGYSGITGSNSASFMGGTDNIQTVVSQSDVDNVTQKLTSAAGNSFAQTFENQLANQGYYVFNSTLNQGTPNVTASPAVGQPASNTTVTVKITYTVLAVKKADLSQAISDGIVGQIDTSKEQLDTSSLLTDASISVANQTAPTDASLSVAENTSAIPLINTASVKAMAEGKKTGDVTAALSGIDGVKSVNIKLSPFWVSKVPKKPSKITVTIQHVNGG